MRKALLLIPVLLVAFAAPAFALYDTSHHDLRTYNSTPNGQSCYHCHSRVVKTSIDNATRDAVGSVGALCLGRCHAMTGIWTSTDPGGLQPQAPSYVTDNGSLNYITPGQNYMAVTFGGGSGSHGRDKSLAGTNRSGFPYDASSSSGYIECTSCHSVHDDTNAPFIWRPMSTTGHTGTAAPLESATTTGLCDACHKDKANVGGPLSTVAPSTLAGNHPVDFVVDTAVAAARTSPSNATTRSHRHGRLIAIDAYYGGRIFDVTTPTVAALRTASGAATWKTGSKMATAANTYGNFASGSSQMGCYTCHSAHQPTQGGVFNNLVALDYEDLVTGYNPLCVGCHGNAATWAADKLTWQVGSLTTYGHPAGDNTAGAAGTAPSGYTGTVRRYTSSAGGFTFNVAITGAGASGTIAPAQYGNNGEIMCSTCHDPHPSVTGYMAIRNLGQTANIAVCKMCHNGVGFPNVQDVSAGGPASTDPTNEVANAHHRTSTAAVAASHTPANEANPLFISTPSWSATSVLGLGNLSYGMDCADCHVFNGTAHNW